AGDMLADAHIVADHFNVSIFRVLDHPHALWEVYKAGFRGFDALFYGIAGFEGYRFGRRGVARAQYAAARLAASQVPPGAFVPPPAATTSDLPGGRPAHLVTVSGMGETVSFTSNGDKASGYL